MTLLYVLASVVLAWYLAPTLTSVLWFLPVRELLDALTPAKLLLGWRDLAERLLWALGLFLLLRATGFTVFAAMPQRYANTPELRLVKGLLVEALVLTGFAVLVIGGLVVTGYWHTVLQGPLVEAVPGADGAVLGSPAAAFRARPWQFVLVALRHVGVVVYPIAGVLYFAVGAHVKRGLAAIAWRVRRVRDLGQMGVGGSSRFAGYVEEWMLKDRRI